MSKEGKIDLLISKSQIYKYNFLESTKRGDTKAAARWKDGYNSIRTEINELKED